MIYFVPNNNQTSSVNYSPNIKIISIDEAVSAIYSTNEDVEFDLETEGFDPHTNEIICFQIGIKDQYVIDGEYLNLFKEFLENRLLLGQNIKFDLRFLNKNGIFPNNVYDTYIAEAVLTNGDKEAKKGLDYLVYKYTGNRLDKSIRGLIHKERLSERVVIYAAEDVMYLRSIRKKQLEEAKRLDVHKAIRLQNRFIPSLAYIEYCGIGFDVDKWLERTEKNELALAKATQELDEWLIKNNVTKYIDNQLDMFSSEIKTTILWSSSSQVVKLFKHLGIDVSTIEEGLEKETVNAKVIAKINHPIIPLYIHMRELMKEVSTYGKTFLKHVNKKTKRIHTNFNQLMNTGRLSSGGKNKSTKEEYVNLQNIPADESARSCFVAEQGNVIITADYSGQEQILLANIALDPALLEFYDNGLADMHSFVASKMYKELEGLSLKEIKDKHADKRNNAKSAGFAINYGGVGATIANNLNISLEEGEAIYNAYFEAFPGLKTYFDNAKKQGLRDGYIAISPLTGFKWFIPFFSRFKELEKEINKDFWEEYRSLKNTESFKFRSMKQKVKEYFKLKGMIERMSLNAPIQGQSSEVTKLACILLYDYIISNKLVNTVKIVNTVHDEIVVECPEELGEKIKEVTKNCMEEAGKYYCKRVPLKADPSISKYWKK